MIAPFKNETKEVDCLSVFQPKKNTFGMRTQSVQSLVDMSIDSEISQRNSRKPRLSRSEKKIDHVTIKKLSELEPSEIVMKLAAPGSGLKEFLNEHSIDFQLVESFLKILTIAIGCMTNRQNLIHLLSKVQGSNFLKQVLPLHILECMGPATQHDKALSFIDHAIVLLNEMVCIFPSSCFTDVKIVETHLNIVIPEILRSNKVFPEEIQVKFVELCSFLNHLQVKKQEGTLRSDNYIYMVGHRANIEEDDFRSLSIYPTHQDIYLDQNPSMRPNIIDGSYLDGKSYLDTHFRLLREDFIRPLRDGISQLLLLKSKDLAKIKLDDIRIYFDIRISFPVCTRNGIVHQIEFSTRNLTQVRWESSKRLLYGALVCLSKDNFENMFFATVADRNVKDLQNGIITLMFTEESRQKLAQHTLDDSFLMVEATAYFEAYRHVLEGLKEMLDTEIPFQEQIVHCDTKLCAPLYLSRNRSGYSLASLITKPISNASETVEFFKRNLCNINRVSALALDVLNFNTWPTEEDLDLDRSQYKALQMALTSKLSIIQGPPGTGKTYVGLKIVHALLANSLFWKEGNSPILVVCYTNHALDQFLEGIHKYRTCKIVRVGSRSNSELMQKCALSNIRSQKRRADLPGYMRAMHAELAEERQKIQDELLKKASYLQNAVKGILHENTLKKYIPPHQFISLMSQKIPFTGISSVMTEWLGASAIYQNTPQRRQDFVLWESENISEESVSKQSSDSSEKQNMFSPATTSDTENPQTANQPLQASQKEDVSPSKTALDTGSNQTASQSVPCSFTEDRNLTSTTLETDNTHTFNQSMQSSDKDYKTFPSTTTIKNGTQSSNQPLHSLQKGDEIFPPTMMDKNNTQTLSISQKRDGVVSSTSLNTGDIHTSNQQMQCTYKEDDFLVSISQCTENTQDALDVSLACEEETDEDLISVSDEAEIAEVERRIEEEDDIKKQIRIARERAAKVGKEILALETEEQSNGDPQTNADKDGWQIPNDVKKKWKKQINRELKKTHLMDEKKYNAVHDVWQLPIRERWELYRWWRSLYLTDSRLQIFDLENQYQIGINRMAELRNQEDLLILQEADIIGMTTTGAAKFRKILQNIRPKIVVVEEAAEVLEAHIITALSSGCQQLILIGDHQQLRPSTTVFELAKNFNLEVSMFERLIRMNIPYVRLDYQHRMRPEIARLLTPHIYDQLENHESVLNFHNIKGIHKNLFFVDHNHLEEHIKEGKSHQNAHEAAFVRSLCLYLIHQGYSPSEITILTTYSGQLYCIQKIMPKSIFEGVRICVVDKFQGEENEIIILSLVRSNLQGNVGFLRIPNRVCVALSRAKKGLFCIGNMQLLSKVPLWSKINDVLKANEQIGKELKLQCQNHPNTMSCVSKSEDFDRVPEGGCMIPCEYRLGCGHVCTLLCHPYDPDHKEFKCKKPCPKVICENGHKCKRKCSDSCGKCEVLVPKTIPICGHTQEMFCSMSPDKELCKVPCTKILKCGHPCVRMCGQVCTHHCPEKIVVKLDCGHTFNTLCHLKSEAEVTRIKLQCNVKCGEELICGHPCPGTCIICSESGVHMDCDNQCGIVLFCSHPCEEKCSTNCFCILACGKKCYHGKCSAKCSEPCTPCTKPCGWNCKHERCTKLCWELCDRKACDEPCQKKLKCGHQCIGLCGEPCPKKCRICNADEVTEWCFGKEADPQARFVQLIDCPHFFEVTEFTKWMNQEEENQVIKLKSCPKCSTTIRQSLRFGTLIKQTLSYIETVKERIVNQWLNQLEVFVSENEDVLGHFPGASQSMRQLQDNQVTQRTLMLVSEKIQFCLKLGAIKEKLQQVPQLQTSVEKQLNYLYNKVGDAKSKYDILEKYHELLFTLAAEVEILSLDGHILNRYIQNIKDLVTKIREKDQTITLDKLREELGRIPAQLELISLIDNKKKILNTEILRQDQWHRCSVGHIYTRRNNEENILNCPQCSYDGDDDDDNEDDQD
ncbi:NFX1-type zinc finger-containing protein 1-like [Discoglossus pictus]